MADFLSPYVKYESSLSRKHSGETNTNQVEYAGTAQGVANEAQLYNIQHNEQSSHELTLLCGLLFLAFVWHWLWDLARKKTQSNT
ncbi:hypothetical protein L2750_00585 [Shewanella submarina]|uniref:Uncharacterized protein n=1 Tax=Shewanella submarina TaxID=2016376 RepID=A0ABV7GEQ7_9GAMM|nr:hypothetical protein [Shewanella submarina]MCL1035655.1 hypothetical protein [Shewanella submarina]